ncbi:GvpL/GvpF family gas vesicle protein [Rhodococcus sp. (in: high G+C Gram-positive bacteria)]|uniref:GvpL/GvpF family gas vesicle protein n=1 Tax=unclassified Rhodococcus (in: high G+C Gram-positive bacteria) TaxID=192944 RepID=UPI0019FE4322|nr:GvpL/GvpF family gas vesicle protein [Rhodococcus sp. (in: high G+C Gram-positive bacteria)]MBF0660848.1 GvpL/GvpF family gas vesicle protein [Rhodococcus sp. (in: high G+C Gram-positive bacteria)]
MSTEQTERPEQGGGDDTHTATAMYVYGIVPSDVEPEEDAEGVGNPPAGISVVRSGRIAALVSEIPTDRALGTPDDLTAHAGLLDGTVTVAPVIPFRFGAVLADRDAVAEELLEGHEDELTAALDQLEGLAQFVVKGRYVERAVLQEILDDDPEAARLREEIRGQSEAATREARMALGEIIEGAIEAKRDEDTRRTIEAVSALDPMVNQRKPTHEQDAVHIAVLVELDRQDELEGILRELGNEWDGRVEISLLGPMAAYDFVTKSDSREED